MKLPPALSSLIFIIILGATSVHGGNLLDACSSNADCGVGLYCSNCAYANATASRCVRNEATPLSNITDLKFSEVSWLVTHNSYAITNFPENTGIRITFTNQEDNVTSQLNNGVRGLMLDSYDFLGDIWLCHSFGGVCYNYTAFEPLLYTLNEVYAFMVANPSEIITIIFEDYVTIPDGLTKVFKAANLTQWWYPVASMPTGGAAWPTIGTMLTNNWRLLVFTSIESKQTTEVIAYQWNFMNENEYGDPGMVAGSCTNRPESNPLNYTGVSLVLQNYFRTDPVEADSCEDNSQPLYNQLPVCNAAAGNRWSNFVAVDFYTRSTGGGSFQAVDKLNGQLECSCNSPLSCENQTIPGQCPDDPTLAEFSSTFVPLPNTGSPPPATAKISTPPETPTLGSAAPADSPQATASASCILSGRTSVVVLVAFCVIVWANHFPL